MEEILTAEQVAKILQVHPFTVLKFIKQGKLKASKLGRVYRIRKSDVNQFLDNQVQQKESIPKKKEEEKKTVNKRKTQEKSESTKSVKEKKREVKETIKKDIVAITEPKQEIKEEKKTNQEQKDSERRKNQNDIDHYILELKAR